MAESHHYGAPGVSWPTWHAILLAQMAVTGERRASGGDYIASSPTVTMLNAPPTLADLGVTRNQASQWQTGGNFVFLCFPPITSALLGVTYTTVSSRLSIPNPPSP